MTARNHLHLVVSGILLSLLPPRASLTQAQTARTTEAEIGSRTLVWSDEFSDTHGRLPDASKWSIVKDGTGFGNHELQYYTGRVSNLHLANGKLVITARKEAYTGADGVSHPYTSARIESAGRFELRYGYVEARIKVPKGQGMWPAFWMLGNDSLSNGWPRCGEIDIMENVGKEPNTVHGSLHGPGYSGSNPLTGAFTLPGNTRFSDNFHVFAVQWNPAEIHFYVDGHLYQTQTAASLPTDKPWVFDHPFYIILNLAVGGNWPGPPDATTMFPQRMLVDYVRVYQLQRAEAAPPL